MVEKSYDLRFDGYWLERSKGDVPANSGIYCVYECTIQTQTTINIRRLIYIGEAENVRERIANHEKQREWNGYVHQGNTLCYSFAPVTSIDRERVEAALIFKHKPPVNTEYKDNFPFDTTHIRISGQSSLLDSSFTVRKTEKSTQNLFIQWR